MIGYILLCILLLIVSSIALVFVFCILLPALRQQQTVDADPVFSQEEVDSIVVSTGFIKAPIDKQAIVLCNSKREFPDGNRMDYNGFKDCKFFKNTYETENDCKWGCTGFGSCISSCPQNAIKIVNHTAVISEMCNGCGLCIDSCPYHLITLIPTKSEYIIPCVSRDKSCSVCSKACNSCNECTDKDSTFQILDNEQILPILPNAEDVARTGSRCANKCLEKYQPLQENTYNFWKKLKKFVIRRNKESVSLLWE